MSKPTKITAEMRETIVTEYPAFLADYKGEPDLRNKEFFKDARARFELLEELTDAQFRGVLVNAKIYQATNPRQAPKKDGKKKSDYVAELNALVGEELTSAGKLTIADLEVLISALQN